MSSTSAKSNLPSTGSTSSHDTAAITVFRFSAAMCGQIGFMLSVPDVLELCNSPASINKGLPSTINCVAVPCLRRWGMDSTALAVALAVTLAMPSASSKKKNANVLVMRGTLGTLTPALSHPMGEGELIHALVANHSLVKFQSVRNCSLSRRTGEGSVSYTHLTLPTKR